MIQRRIDCKMIRSQLFDSVYYLKMYFAPLHFGIELSEFASSCMRFARCSRSVVVLSMSLRLLFFVVPERFGSSLIDPSLDHRESARDGGRASSVEHISNAYTLFHLLGKGKAAIDSFLITYK